MTQPASTTMYGLLAEFPNEQALVAAARRAQEAGYTLLDAYTPYPVDELTDALNLPKTSIPLLVLVGGVVGGGTAYLMQWYCSVIGYPVNAGGRPLHSWPAFIPITFELTVLFAALFGVLGMLILNRLPQPYHPIFNVARFERASQDGFFLCLEAADPRFDDRATRQFLEGLKPSGLWEVPSNKREIS